MRRLITCLLGLSIVTACAGAKEGVSTGGKGGGKNRDGGADTNGDGGGPRRNDAGLIEPPPFKPDSTDWKIDATGDSGLSQDVIDELKGGGKSCSAKVLYPYDKTIFPAGLQAPTIMWEGESEAAYVKLKYERVTTLDYQYATSTSSPGSLIIPAEHWMAITRRSQGTPLQVTLTTKRGGELSTCEFEWTIAQGSMNGSVYYNTYNHPSTGGMGAVMRLRLGTPEPEVYLSFSAIGIPGMGPCTSCHSVSFNGSRLAASTHLYAPVVQSFEAASYAITPMSQPPRQSPLPESTFGALTPDGSLILGMGNPDCTAGSDAFPRSPNNFPLLVGPSKATLHDASNGRPVDARGLRPEWYMWMPQFSPSGDKVVFNHAKPGAGGTDRRELAVMDYDHDTRTFSNLKVIASRVGPEPSLPYAPVPTPSGPVGSGASGCTQQTPNAQGAQPRGTCTGPCYPAWPFFTPDGKGVVFALISEPDFTVAFPGRDKASKSELWYVDVESGERVRLDNANKGLAPGDSLANYYPTVLPVQVGGYYWIFWTSTRNYGHVNLNPSVGQLASNPFAGAAALEATRKRIWVSALRPRRESDEFGQEDLADFSSPAFYLDGQSATGNVRAFAALNPCKSVGNDCTSGLDCCDGYCTIDEESQTGTCASEPPLCADVNEKCKVDSDCCQPEEASEPKRQCLGGYCGFQVVI